MDIRDRTKKYQEDLNQEMLLDEIAALKARLAETSKALEHAIQMKSAEGRQLDYVHELEAKLAAVRAFEEDIRDIAIQASKDWEQDDGIVHIIKEGLEEYVAQAIRTALDKIVGD